MLEDPEKSKGSHPSWVLSPSKDMTPVPSEIKDLDYGDVIEYLVFNEIYQERIVFLIF